MFKSDIRYIMNFFKQYFAKFFGNSMSVFLIYIKKKLIVHTIICTIFVLSDIYSKITLLLQERFVQYSKSQKGSQNQLTYVSKC